MRIKFFLTGLAILLGATSAAADITARYAQKASSPMIVQVSDGGDSRIEVVGAAYLNTGGVSYLVANDARGRFTVRLDTFTALIGDLMRASRNGSPASRIEVRISEHGAETIAGRNGRLFRISATSNPSDAIDMVVSSDADLAPLARVMSRDFGPMLMSAGQQAPAVIEAMVALMNRGALLRLGDLWRLESVDTMALEPSIFALPSAPISREELIEHIRPSRPR